MVVSLLISSATVCRVGGSVKVNESVTRCEVPKTGSNTCRGDDFGVKLIIATGSQL
jgi:hypothetical protein